MSLLHRVELGTPSLLEFSGPDAVRYLNGQLTQDVRRVVAEGISLPSCVTDAKGRLQHRVSLLAPRPGALWVAGQSDESEALEARLTRYLIADDVEVIDRSGQFRLLHFIGMLENAPTGVLVKESNRYGIPGTDWWVPATSDVKIPSSTLLDGDALEALRIEHAVPAWGKELQAGMLPPEGRLDQSDISYAKGCYIGQEVISRIKSAGKVNRLLTAFEFDDIGAPATGEFFDDQGKPAGEITSVSPRAEDGVRRALGYLKRTAVGECFTMSTGGNGQQVRRRLESGAD